MQIRLFRKTITFGYILIAVLIGSIAYTSFYEWRKLETLEEENRQIDRFCYYSPKMGMYISSGPIDLAGNNPTLYGYVQDVNTWFDVFGLEYFLDKPKKKANTADVGDIIRTPDTHPQDFSSIKGSPNYKNDYTDEIWSPSHTNHSHSTGGEWKVGIGRNVNPTPTKELLEHQVGQ